MRLYLRRYLYHIKRHFSGWSYFDFRGPTPSVCVPGRDVGFIITGFEVSPIKAPGLWACYLNRTWLLRACWCGLFDQGQIVVADLGSRFACICALSGHDSVRVPRHVCASVLDIMFIRCVKACFVREALDQVLR